MIYNFFPEFYREGFELLILPVSDRDFAGDDFLEVGLGTSFGASLGILSGIFFYKNKLTGGPLLLSASYYGNGARVPPYLLSTFLTSCLISASEGIC